MLLDASVPYQVIVPITSLSAPCPEPGSLINFMYAPVASACVFVMSSLGKLADDEVVERTSLAYVKLASPSNSVVVLPIVINLSAVLLLRAVTAPVAKSSQATAAPAPPEVNT